MPAPAPPDLDDVVHIILSNGVVTFVGSNTVQVSGLPPEHFHGRHVLDLVHPDDRLQVERLLTPGWTGRFSEHIRIQEVSGAWAWRVAEGVRTVDASGEPQSVLELRKIGPPQR
jgi:PAS domain-containing protein